MSKDRLSIHQDSGGPLIQEAFTIMRDGGTLAQSGLVGITNSGYPEGGQPILPETIFNVQSVRDSNIRFSSGPSGVGNTKVHSAVQILGNGNMRASGLQLTYYPDCDDATVDDCVVCDEVTYKRYELESCIDGSTIQIFDTNNLNPSVDLVAFYYDSAGESGCGIVKGFSEQLFEDGSYIDKIYTDCDTCEEEGGGGGGGSVYKLGICGGVDQAEVYVYDPGSVNPSVGQVVGYNDPITGLGCGEVLAIQNGSSSIPMTIIYDDCDACQNPDPGDDVYEILNCDGLTTHYATDVSGVAPSPLTVVQYGSPYNCGTVVGPSNDPKTHDGIKVETFDDCPDCLSDLGGDVLLYEIEPCPAFPQRFDIPSSGIVASSGDVVLFWGGEHPDSGNMCGIVQEEKYGADIPDKFVRAIYEDCDACADVVGPPPPPPEYPETIYRIEWWGVINGCDPDNPPGGSGPGLPCNPCCQQYQGWAGSGTGFSGPCGGFACAEFVGASSPQRPDGQVKVLFEKDYESEILIASLTGCPPDCSILAICDDCETISDIMPIYGDFGYLGINPTFENLSINVGGKDNVVSDLSLIRASGTDGIEFGHLSFTERGYVGIGLTKIGDHRTFTPVAPLTINYNATDHRDSGTIAMKAQDSSPSYNGQYGKVYVKPYTDIGGTHAIYFLDGGGNEYNLLDTADIACCDLIDSYEGPSGMVYGDEYCNTYAGWHTPAVRQPTATILNNTYFGWAAGFDLGTDDVTGPVFPPNDNTLIGCTAGSGLNEAQNNTVIGSESLKNFERAINMTVVGYRNVRSALPVPAEDPVPHPMSGIIIGTNLFNNSDPAIGALYIGHSTFPVVTGQVADPTDRTFAVDDATFIVSTGDSNFTINKAYTGHYDVRLTAVDLTNSTDKAYRNSININFSNAGDYIFNMAEFNPSGAERANVPTYASQGFNYMQLNSDFRLQGAIRFQDGTSLSGVPDWLAYTDRATSGVNLVQYGFDRWAVLDFTELSLAELVSSDVRTDNTFVSVQLDGTSSSNMGKMSLQGLADYLSDAFVNISENCNVIITDPENALDVNAAANSESVFIGCNVATNASGWKNTVMIGTEAGQNATTPNPTLSTDTSSIFIGYKAGRDCDNVDNVIAIGANAGNESDGASDSIFLGASAGTNSNFKDSVGIGANALRGTSGSTEIGSGNIEIVANLLDSQTLFSSAGAVDYKLNIQNSIAGDTDSRNISIGAARLSPEAPLEVRRDTSVHAGNSNVFIQSWFCDSNVVGAVECDGSLSGFFVEGLLDGNLTAPANISSPTSATLSVYINGVDTTQNVTVTNRNPNFSASSADYLIAMKIGGEYRPIN